MSHSELEAQNLELRAQTLADYANAKLALKSLSMPQVPIFLEAACISFLRERFRGDDVFAWEDDEDESANQIWIGTEYPRDLMESRDTRPLVTIGFRGVTSTKMVLDDLMQKGALDPRAAHVNSVRADFQNIPIRASIMAMDRFSAVVLAGEIHSVFRTAGNFIRQSFNVQGVSAPQMGEPSIVRDYPDFYMVPVSFSVEVIPKWTSKVTEQEFSSVTFGIRGIVEKKLLKLQNLNPSKFVRQEIQPDAP